MNMSYDSSQIDKWLPSFWLGLFKTLKNQDSPLETAEIWYQKNVMSQTRTGVGWGSLLYALSAEEPFATEGALQFKPRLLLLPDNIQRNFLTFILHHRQDIQYHSLKGFTEALSSKVKSDSWPCVLVRILSCYIQQHDSNDTKSRGFAPYAFTAENMTAAMSLSQRLKTEPSSGCQLWNSRTCLDPFYNLDFTGSVGSDDKNANAEAATYATPEALDVTAHSQSEDCIMLIEEDIKEDTLSQKTIGSQEKIESSNTAENRQPLDDSVLENVAHLRDCWCIAAVTDIDPPETISVLLSVTSQQMATVCEYLRLSSFMDSAVATACRHLGTVVDSISYANCAVFLESLFLLKLQNLCEGASRLFIAAMLDVAETFPKQLIDVVLVPCTVGNIGQPQLDVLCKVVSEILVPEDKVYLLRKMLENPGIVDDNYLSFLQVIVGSKIDVDEHMLQMYLSLLEKVSYEMRKNQKYGKLILITVQKYGKQMTVSHLLSVDNIVSCHDTFLKKTISTLVEKLKK